MHQISIANTMTKEMMEHQPRIPIHNQEILSEFNSIILSNTKIPSPRKHMAAGFRAPITICKGTVLRRWAVRCNTPRSIKRDQSLAISNSSCRLRHLNIHIRMQHREAVFTITGERFKMCFPTGNPY